MWLILFRASDVGERRWVAARRTAVVGVNLIHTLLFFSIAASILHIFYAGVTNRGSRLTKGALAIALSESLIFVGAGWRCPPEGLQSGSAPRAGRLPDIFLPRWFANRIHLFFTPPLLIGLLGLVLNRRRQRQEI